MTGLVRKATLLSVGGLLFAGAAMASVPSMANSTVRPIALLPRTGVDLLTTARTGIPTLYCITVHDQDNNPMPGEPVTLDFGPCTTAGATDIELCSSQQAGVTSECGAGLRRVTITAGAGGQACFNIIGNADNHTGSDPVPAPCIEVFSGSTFLGQIGYSAYDQDGLNGADGTDLFLFFQDQNFVGPVRARSNYDNTGTVDGTDLFLFFAVQGNPSAGVSCTPNPNCIP